MAEWPLGGFQEDLVLKHGTSLNCGVGSFRKTTNFSYTGKTQKNLS